MAAHLHDVLGEAAHAIPLLDASSLPSAEDWTLLEAIHAHWDSGDADTDTDRFGRFRLTAAFDE